MRLLPVSVLVMLACSTGPTGPSEKDDRSGPADTGDSDTGPHPEPSECEAPSLRLMTQLEHLDFVDVDEFEVPVALASCGWGLAAVDLNGDGLVDLLPLGHTDPTRALVNHDGVLSPSDEVRFDGGPLPAANGVGVGDINGDGLPDLVVVRSSGMSDLVYRNLGGGEFSSTPLPESTVESQDAALFDADLDGDLDLYVSRHIDIWETHPPSIEAGLVRGEHNGLYLNEDGILSPAPVGGITDAASFQAVPLDVDADGDLDLYIANDFGMFIAPNSLLLNDGSGGFSASTDCACDLEMFGMGASASDFNNDGNVDLNITNFGSPRTLMGMGDGSFVDATASSGALIQPSMYRVTSWGTAFADIDQDGWDDMLTAFGPVLMGMDGDWSDLVDHPELNDLDDAAQQANAFFHNTEGHFEDQSTEVGFDLFGVTRAVVTADFNADGMPDVAISGLDGSMRQVVRIYQGEAGCGPGITIGFPERGGQDVGAQIDWSVGGEIYRRWYQPGTTYSVSGPTMHLGLGGHAVADYVRITPLGGTSVEYEAVSAGTRIDQRSYQ